MKLESKRLTMTPMTDADWPLFQQLQNDESVMRYVGDGQPEQEQRASFEQRLAPWDKHQAHWLSLVITDKTTGAQVGTTGLIAQWQPYRQAEVGFLLLPGHQGKGYGRESLAAVVDFAFNQCNFHKLRATVTEGNDACVRLLTSIGFKQEGRLRDNYRIAGQWRNDLLFGLLQSDFHPPS